MLTLKNITKTHFRHDLINEDNMINSTLAPVALFVYARPVHTQRTIDALLLNPEALSTDLIVYSDGAKSDKDITAVNKVRNIIINTVGFNTITLIEREVNVGLAKNIIDGVSETCKKYGKVIVLEDDIVTSSCFLNFMNSALNKYKNNKNVWHVSGWNYPLKNIDNLPETFFWRTMNCWGWATWNDRWKHFEKNPKKLLSTWTKEDVKSFNLDYKYDFWVQVINNDKGLLNTWAIFWYATIFRHKGLCLNPTKTYVTNIGNDGSGENCGSIDIYKTNLNDNAEIDWPHDFNENTMILNEIKKFYYMTGPFLFPRIIRKLKRVFKL
ncbi:hypothetical protein [Pectobacterium brasiliense]|uniref:hypothetical protein n=1 Tax=Pectobacterium brasiliense TaxID=180957 RepID=UPI00196936BC|nr:hypothetical protein [Pectobacterium brasiliense]